MKHAPSFTVSLIIQAYYRNALITGLFIRPLTLDDDIFGHLNRITDLLNFGSTSKDAYIRIRAFLSRTYRLRRLLSQFLNPEELETFQKLQRRSGLLISGQALLFFLLQSKREPDQLDLFLHVQYKELFCEWINSTRYVVDGDPSNMTEQVKDIEGFDRGEKTADWSSLVETHNHYTNIALVLPVKGTSKKIVVHFSQGAPIQMILDLPTSKSVFDVLLGTPRLFSHPLLILACLMNIATHSRIYCLYPKATLQRGISLLRPHWRQLISMVDLEPYFHLNIRFMDTCWDSVLHLFPYGRRRVGDEFTFIINIDLENENADIDQRLLANSWLVYYLPKGDMDIHGITIRSSRLQDAYIVSDEPVRKSVDSLVGRLSSESSNIPSSDFFDTEFCREVLHEIFPQSGQLRLLYK